MSERDHSTLRIEYFNYRAFEKSLKDLSKEEFLELIRVMNIDFQRYVDDIFADQSAKWLGDGLAEYRYRRNPNLLVRVFFCFTPGRVVILISAYNKKKDPSTRRQNLEIARARRLMKTIDLSM